jgi:outer membrane protein OmpA-like peptidoglycan-associated protein
MSIIGYGSKYQLYPYAATDWEAQQNRRVEINVLSLDGSVPVKENNGK